MFADAMYLRLNTFSLQSKGELLLVAPHAVHSSLSSFPWIETQNHAAMARAFASLVEQRQWLFVNAARGGADFSPLRRIAARRPPRQKFTLIVPDTVNGAPG
ncbi:MAG: hypothetical protein ACLQME_07715 [Alphaproteobacteria bacterium]